MQTKLANDSSRERYVVEIDGITKSEYSVFAPRAEHPNTQARARRDVMFGCSDVYHWMGRTAKAVCLPDCGRRSSTT